MAARSTRAPGGNAVLTRREQDVIQGVAAGLINREIANQLYVSKKTIDFHLANIYTKMGITNRVQAINKARELGLLSQGGVQS